MRNTSSEEQVKGSTDDVLWISQRESISKVFPTTFFGNNNFDSSIIIILVLPLPFCLSLFCMFLPRSFSHRYRTLSPVSHFPVMTVPSLTREVQSHSIGNGGIAMYCLLVFRNHCLLLVKNECVDPCNPSRLELIRTVPKNRTVTVSPFSFG